jgi:hypothetical protein
MQKRTASVVGCILLCVLLAAIFALAAVMPNTANRWIDEGIALAPYQILLLELPPSGPGGDGWARLL